MKKLMLALVFSLGLVGGSIAVAQADDWGQYTYIGNGVSVSYARVMRDHGNCWYWTWRFRNDGFGDITSMRFSYDGDCDAEESDGTDILPTTLHRGGVFGGWSAYTSVTTYSPSIRITEIERR